MSKYISLENLSRYDAKMQERTASFCASKEDGMWRQTEKAGAVQFWPVGNSPLEGTVEFMFKETGPASGTKSPDNPSTISGVSTIGLTVCQEEGVDEHSYSLSLGGTYYGGSIDLATGLMTVTVGATVLDENYNFGTTSGYLTEYDNFYAIVFYPGFGPYATGNSIPSTFTSNRLPIEFKYSTGVPTQNSLLLSPGSRGMKLCVSKADLSLGDGESITTVRAAMLQWLSTHPVTVVCPLENASTVQLSPLALRSLPQPDKYVPRLNTVYSDADAVQIVYQKNPVRDKFEKVQAIIAQGGNV